MTSKLQMVIKRSAILGLDSFRILFSLHNAIHGANPQIQKSMGSELSENSPFTEPISQRLYSIND